MQQSVTPQDLSSGCPWPRNSGVERVRYRQAKRKTASGRRLLGRRLLPPHLEQGWDHSSPMAGDSSAAVSVSRIPQPGGAPLLSLAQGYPGHLQHWCLAAPSQGLKLARCWRGWLGAKGRVWARTGKGTAGRPSRSPWGGHASAAHIRVWVCWEGKRGTQGKGSEQVRWQAKCLCSHKGNGGGVSVWGEQEGTRSSPRKEEM